MQTRKLGNSDLNLTTVGFGTPELTSAIVGARRPSHIEETVAAGDWELPPEDIAEIEMLLAERERALA